MLNISNFNTGFETGDVGLYSAGPRLGETHISHAHASAVSAFISSDVAVVKYVTPGRSLVKTLSNVSNDGESWPATVALPDSADACRIWAPRNVGLQHRIFVVQSPTFYL